MNMSPAFRILALCLLFLARPPAAPAMTMEEYQALFDEGRTAFQSGQPGEAYDTFNRLFLENPRDPAVNFMLGRSAFAQGMYEEALMIYERILIETPDNQRARLELGRVLMRLGAYENAKLAFSEVLASSPPDTVRRNIERYIQAADRALKRHFLSGLLSAFAGWDDNPQVLPDDRTIDIPAFTGLSFEFEEKDDDWFGGSYLQLGHRYKPDAGRLFWESALINYNIWYDTQSTESLSYVSIQTGPGATTHTATLSCALGASHMQRHYKKYLDAFHLSASVNHALSQHLGNAVTTRLELRDFEDDARDSFSAIVGVQPIYIRNRLRCFLGLRYEYEDAESPEYDLHRVDLLPGLTWAFPAAVTGRLAGRYSYSHYKGPYSLFEEKRRDHLMTITSGISKPIWVSKSKHYQLVAGLDHTWTKACSSIDLYDYDQNRTTLSGTLKF